MIVIQCRFGTVYLTVKHLDRYLDEFEFRFNNRKNEYLFRDTITRLVTAKALLSKSSLLEGKHWPLKI